MNKEINIFLFLVNFETFFTKLSKGATAYSRNNELKSVQ